MKPPASSAGPSGSPPAADPSGSGPSGSPPPEPVSSGAGTTITVPDVTGKTKAEAEAALRGAGVRGAITYDNDPGSVDRICNQVPGGGNQTSSTLVVGLRYCQDTARPQKGPPQLRGLSIAAATKLAQQTGFTGKVEVIEQSDFDADCKADTVCRVHPDHWELDQDRTLTLYVNRKVSIGAPPPP